MRASMNESGPQRSASPFLHEGLAKSLRQTDFLFASLFDLLIVRYAFIVNIVRYAFIVNLVHRFPNGAIRAISGISSKVTRTASRKRG